MSTGPSSNLMHVNVDVVLSATIALATQHAFYRCPLEVFDISIDVLCNV